MPVPLARLSVKRHTIHSALPTGPAHTFLCLTGGPGYGMPAGLLDQHLGLQETHFSLGIQILSIVDQKHVITVYELNLLDIVLRWPGAGRVNSLFLHVMRT